MYNVVVKKVHIRYLISWRVSCCKLARMNTRWYKSIQCPWRTQLCYHSSRNSNPDFNVPLLLSASSCNNIWNSFSNTQRRQTLTATNHHTFHVLYNTRNKNFKKLLTVLVSKLAPSSSYSSTPCYSLGKKTSGCHGLVCLFTMFIVCLHLVPNSTVIYNMLCSSCWNKSHNGRQALQSEGQKYRERTGLNI